MKPKKQGFKYLSQERVEEVYRIFEQINGQSRDSAFPYQYGPQPNYYDINKPFEQFSMLQYDGLEFKITSSS